MPRSNRGILFFFAAVAALATLFVMVPRITRAQLKFRALETRDLRVVYYDDEHRYVIPHLARCFENSMGYYREFFGYVPTEKVTVLLQDFDDYGYAGTSSIPNNYLTLGIEPFEYVYETCPTNERFNWVINHELVHLVTSEKSNGQDRFWRRVFGGKVGADSDNPESIFYSFLSNPRRYAPRWYHEGAAVFMETWLAGGIGRSLGGYDEMAFRTKVLEGDYFYDVIGLESEGTTSDFQIGQNSYLYGTRFMSFLALEHGPDKVVDWINRREDTRAYYQSDFHRVFGVSLSDEWRRWIEFEGVWQTENLASVRTYPLTAERRLGAHALGSMSRGFYDPIHNEFYVAVNYPGEPAHIAAINVGNGTMRKICRVRTPALYYVTSLAWDPAGEQLFFTTNNGKHWRDLHVVNVRTGDSRALLANNRTGDLAFSRADSTLWGVQHHNGISTIVRMYPPYDAWHTVEEMLILPYGRDVFDLDVSPDGEWLTCAMLEIDGTVRLVRVNIPALVQGDAGYSVLYTFTNTAPSNFVFSPDGRYLYGTAYESGVSNVFRFDTQTETMEAVTNVEAGLFRPVPIPGDSVIACRYTVDGLWPVIVPDLTIEDIEAVRYLGQAVVDTWPVVADWKIGSPRSVDLDSVTTYDGTYHKFRSVRVASFYPVVEGYKNTATVGVRLNYMDPLGLHGGDLVVSVSPWDHLPDDEIGHAKFTYRHFPWTLGATYNRTDFYDLFGPRRTSRKGHSVSLSRSDWLITDSPRYLQYNVTAAWFGGLEEVPFYQDVPATFDEFGTVYAELDYKNTISTIGAVEKESGVAWNLGYAGDVVNEDFYSKFRGRVDIGVATPIDHSSLWVRGYGGYSFGDPENTFANFYFGGFQNNYVDHQDVKRYRDYETFPGVEINSVSGTRFGMAMLEWTLPPWRFERVGIPNLYCTWMRAAVFFTGLGTNFGVEGVREKVANAGIQLDFRLIVFSGLESMLSFGYAGSTRDGYKPDQEFMVSLKIL